MKRLQVKTRQQMRQTNQRPALQTRAAGAGEIEVGSVIGKRTEGTSSGKETEKLTVMREKKNGTASRGREKGRRGCGNQIGF